MTALGPADEALLDGAPCGLVETDAKGVFLRVNKPFCVWLGYDKADLVGKKRLQDLLTMGARIFHQTHWAPLLEMQGSISELKLDIRHKNGSTLPMVLNVVRHGHGPNHTQEVALFVARDRDKYEQELLLSRKKLETHIAEVERLQAETKDRALFAEQMIGIVSHDLRNPLSAVHTGIQVLFKHAPTDNQARVLSRMAQSVDRANRLVSDLLDFTVARVGKGIAINPQPVDLHEVVAQSVAELALSFPDRTLRHETEGRGACRVDPDRMAQLVGNLVANAVSYGDPDREVTVKTSVNPERVEVSVHNWGAAIPSELISALFQPMVRGSAVGTGRSVGLGLFIIMGIAKAHGGEVTVESSNAEGTTFIATLPAFGKPTLSPAG
ncbi:PAS domain-containing sensor histidine kinase [Variovorax sp. S2]|uniref:PAS domain-containing sensor histidine kinase n=1 Tax=unclassified Variovorax TaxID=663243 RepID=UPI00215BBD7F|nr:PAS domain-containing sensor histidine kinase [Variovorax sp. S12S4]MCR8960715.1 PAS domain-containing sensor histidine kinase [Variovorax sp. S12S4]